MGTEAFFTGIREQITAERAAAQGNVLETVGEAEHDETIRFFRNFPVLLFYCYQRHIDLDIQQLSKFADVWDWRWLSTSSRIELDSVKLAAFSDRWDWTLLSRNSSIPWSVELLSKFSDKWDWTALSKNKSIPWTAHLIALYVDKWNWSALSSNDVVPWSRELIETYIDRWEFGKTDGPFYEFTPPEGWLMVGTAASVVAMKPGLSSNPGLPWSVELIEAFADRWEWTLLSMNNGLPWTKQFIDRYIDQWDWVVLGANESIEWPPELTLYGPGEIEWEYQYRGLDICGLRVNKKIRWSVEAYRKWNEGWETHFCWPGYDNSFEWTLDLLRDSFEIDRCDESSKWDWNELSQNTKLPWSEAFIDEFANDISWTEFCWNGSITWSTGLLRKYSNRLNWDEMSLKSDLPWSKELFRNFSDLWDWESVSQHQDFGLRDLPKHKLTSLIQETFGKSRTDQTLKQQPMPRKAVMQTISVKGQQFDLIGHRPYTKKDGAESVILVWKSKCKVCDAEFEYTSPSIVDRSKFIFTCPEHRRHK